NLKLEENGLLYTDGKDKAVTWMNSTANGRPVVPRTGYIVEFNALWYNALCFCASLAATAGEEDSQQKLLAQAEQTKQAFLDTFLNEYGYLYDYVDGNMMDWSVRPNMIFAVAFDYSPLSQDQKKQVLDICTRELLTPKGLRSLSPKSGGYNPVYVGPQTQRDYAYHQGTAWPWLGGFYMEASLKLYKRTRLSFIERQMVGYDRNSQAIQVQTKVRFKILAYIRIFVLLHFAGRESDSLKIGKGSSTRRIQHFSAMFADH
ncbi:glycogen debranching enzyme-related protein, partial [human gut metagenome]